MILLGYDETFSGPCFPGVLSLSLFLFVTIWVTSLGPVCEAAIFTELLFYPNLLGVTKWFTPVLPTGAASRLRIVQVLRFSSAPIDREKRSQCYAVHWP